MGIELMYGVWRPYENIWKQFSEVSGSSKVKQHRFLLGIETVN